MMFDPSAPVDVPRDWLEFSVSALGVIGSLAIGGLALVVAMRANRHAKDAERRSREFVTAERLRVFELEILRDLADAIDEGTAITRDHMTRLSLLPDWELPQWRRWEVVRDSSDDNAVRYLEFLGRSNRSNTESNEEVRSILRVEVQAAIRRRMTGDRPNDR